MRRRHMPDTRPRWHGVSHPPGASGRAPAAPVLLFVALALAHTGCAPREQAPPPAPEWNWQAYPVEDRLLVAQLPAHAGPARTQALRAPASGTLQLSGELKSEQLLPTGTVWSRIDPEDTVMEEDALRRLETEIGRRQQRYVELERPALLAQLEHELRLATDTAAAATFAEREPGLFTGERPALDPALRPALSAKQAADTLAALRERRDRLAAGDAALEPADLQTLRAELERRRATRETRARQLQLTTPFAGRLVLADRQDARVVAAGETIALIADPATLRISVRPTATALLAVPAASLEAEVSLPGAATVRALFSGSGFDASGATVLWFDAPADPAVINQLGAAGAELPTRLFTRLSGPAHIVPKLAVARYDSRDALAAGWRDAVPQLFPGAKLAAEGRTAVAIQPPSRP